MLKLPTIKVCAFICNLFALVNLSFSFAILTHGFFQRPALRAFLMGFKNAISTRKVRELSGS